MKYIADTNVLLKSPTIVNDYDIVITSHVLREVEHLEKTRKNDRQLQYEIRRLKRELNCNKHSYVMDIKDYSFTLNNEWDSDYVDNILIQIAVDNKYGIATNDLLLREKCRLYSVEVLEQQNNSFTEYNGFREIFMLDSELREHYREGLTSNTFKDINNESFVLMENEYLVVYNDLDGTLMDILKWNGHSLESLSDKNGKLGKGFKTFQFGEFKPKDPQQIIAIDSILNNQLTSIRGRAGSGKSLIALNTAWKLVESYGYKLVIFANPTPLRNSQELGFYPGTQLEKILQSSTGAMLKSKFGDEVEVIRHIQDGKLDILPFVDLRGYDSGDDKCIIWVVEAQNLTSDLLKLGLQRITESTKVIVDGDYHSQVDKDVYSYDNGMKRMSEVFRGSDIYGEVELQNVYRSRLADLAELM